MDLYALVITIMIANGNLTFIGTRIYPTLPECNKALFQMASDMRHTAFDWRMNCERGK